MYHVSEIFAESFGLPKGSWHKALQLFKGDLDSLNDKIDDAIKDLPLSS
jgi:hypothetical protein